MRIIIMALALGFSSYTNAHQCPEGWTNTHYAYEAIRRIDAAFPIEKPVMKDNDQMLFLIANRLGNETCYPFRALSTEARQVTFVFFDKVDKLYGHYTQEKLNKYNLRIIVEFAEDVIAEAMNAKRTITPKQIEDMTDEQLMTIIEKGYLPKQ